ncbi:pseudoazurin [Pararhodobacter aggregans]
MIRLALLLSVLASPLLAETHEVRMYSHSEAGPMVYEPSFLRIEPGDSVRFLPTQPGHNAATIDGMLPDGAEPFRSQINADVTVTLTIPGFYGIKCSPHYAMGMVMVIEVGEGAVRELPDDLPPRARQRFEAILDAAAP